MRPRLSQLVPGIALAFALAAPAMAASTAKAALKEVTAASKQWQPDAVLTHVSTLAATPDGKARSWLYTAYSPQAKKSAIVTARDLKVEVEPVNRNTSVEPLAGDWMDSDKAMDAARKAGLETGAGGTGLGLTTFGAGSGKRVYWTVTVMTDAAISSVTLDPATGAFVRRDDVKLK
ncbi:MAG: hypothetical protein KA200_06075 [Burkholderiales bacterium]|nr:hypothetical protein [Burkholderiales bacterium]